VNPLDEKILTAFPTGRPLEDKVDVVQCKHCRRPVHRSISANHIRECLNKKQEKLKKKKEAKEAKDAALRREKGEDDEGGPRKSAGKGAIIDGDGAKKGKKRKLDGDAEKAPNAKKKKKDEQKAKAAKQKGPVDVEKQCGVALPNGGFCARSLTCKSHSMGLKRAVPGRTLPYDMLLQQYQKKNHAKQQRKSWYGLNCGMKANRRPQVPHWTPTLLCPTTWSPRVRWTLRKRRIPSWQPFPVTDHNPLRRTRQYRNGQSTSSSA
jgi:SAGA-associated factor 73